ncbi:MAG: sulfatase, partial [Actinomycetota bacterium]|nr:sulfatase [Actinomycetota bacterium]
MTDDQEVASLDVMPEVRKRLAGRGMTFENAFVSYPLCCPSRATFQTGQYAHNHRVLSNKPPDGGYPAFDPTETMAVWLQRAGYETAHVGKYLNAYTKKDAIPPGWDRWFAMVRPDSRYFKTKVNDQGEFTKFGKDDSRDYSTDLFTARAVNFLKRRKDKEQPFFLSVGYVAPHVAKSFQEDGGHCADKGPEPAPRHLGEFRKKRIPRGPSFNENDVSDKPSEIRNRKKLAGDELAKKTEKYQCRLETLLSVDEGVRDLVKALRNTGELDDTYFIYVSDNGFIQGEHRIDGGKAVPYEGAIRVPMIVRGPDVPRGEVADELASNVDVVPTLVELAGAKAGIDMDGRSLLPALTRPRSRDGRAILIESYKKPEVFRGVRTGRFLYVERASGESELYDLREDPDELENIHANPVYERARSSLQDLLERLRDCQGDECATTPALELRAERVADGSENSCRTAKAAVGLAGA